MGSSRNWARKVMVCQLATNSPRRAVIDLQAPPGGLRDQPVEAEICLPAPLQPIAVRPRNLLRLIAADLVRFDAANLAKVANPVDSRNDGHAKLGCGLMAR
jgi:hypothetical protein